MERMRGGGSGGGSCSMMRENRGVEWGEGELDAGNSVVEMRGWCGLVYGALDQSYRR